MLNNSVSAGASQVMITPPVGCSLSGYYTDRRATGIRDPLFARALVLGKDETAVAIVSCDLLGLTANTVAAIRARAAGTGLPAERIMIACTHTHTGPATTSIFLVEQDREYLTTLTERVAEAIVQARERQEEAVLSMGWATESTTVFNRRFLMRDGTVVTNPGPRNPDIVRPAGPVDPLVGILKVTSSKGKTLAILVNRSNHVDSLGGTLISADWPEDMGQRIKKSWDTHAVVIFLNGASGNINHVDVYRDRPLRGEAVVNELGEKVAQSVLSAHYSSLAGVSLSARSKRLRLSVRSVSGEDLERARELCGDGSWEKEINDSLDAFDLAQRNLMVEKIFAREKIALAKSGKSQETLEIQALKIGELGIVGIPGELFVELGLTIKKMSPFPHTFVVGLANGCFGYIPHRGGEGGYEEFLSRASFLEWAAGEKLVKTAVEMFKQVK